MSSTALIHEVSRSLGRDDEEELMTRLTETASLGALPDAGPGVPTGPAWLEPGVLSTVWLEEVDPFELPVDERFRVLEARWRLVAHHQAALFQAMAAIVDAVSDEFDTIHGGVGPAVDEAAQAASAEIRACLRLTRRAADHDVATAMGLRRRLPAVLESMAAGRIDRRKAGVLLHGTDHLPVAEAQAVVAEVLTDAEWMTTGQLRHRLQRLCMAADPTAAERRYWDSVEERRVVLEATESGAGMLAGYDLPADRAAAARNRIETLARSLRGGDEARTMDQLRADVFLDLLCGSDTSSPRRAGADRGTVTLTVGLATLAGLDDMPGDLAGYGPVVADVARQVAEQHRAAEWRFAVTDPDTGAVDAAGLTRRRPSAALRRNVTLERPTCVFPGCRQPAVRADIDHRVPFADGGATDDENLDPLCRTDHGIRHRYLWSHERLGNGDHLWTSPLGQRATTYGTDGIRPVRPP